MSFKPLGLDPNILQAIQEAGYTEPTPIQAAAIPVVIAGGDVIGIAQTGTGKTAAFTLPILTRLTANPVPQGQRRRTRVLVLAPTRELVAQIEENVLAYARHLPLKIAKVYGGVGEKPQKDALRAGSDIVIACPGRLLDLMGQRCADFSQLEYLVLDEADRMLDMGFLPDIRRVINQLPKKRQTLMFSATLSKEIESLTHEFQHSPKIVQIGKRSNPAETVTQLVYEVPKHLKMALLAHLLEDESMQMVLVFSRTKHGADKIARKLEQGGVKCATLHANRSQNQRLRALDDFKSGAVRVLVATDIAARGIDVDGISHVVNFDFPHIVEDYVHRIGRTGRAQAIGDAISFVSPDELSDLRKLERFVNRGLVRKKAEGFNYNASAPVFTDERPERRNQRQFQPRRPQGGQGGSRHGGQGGGRQGGNGGGRQEGQGQGQPRRDSSNRPQREAPPKSGARTLWNRLTGKK
ncbi:DEAD/DEAH box helicase [Prosthecobacter sp.]|uniref:DEAD/DEAH box helicase n=1 Tax=Prosthecobacter sp. TaxID=1965333 RepID=UPI001E0D829B|nr:DEAD/DEAH box helicase [Prosthecobacter sp.]MCB1277119.1 DEAD/DEAH box helicase [Prosthecobacter sp.]